MRIKNVLIDLAVLILSGLIYYSIYIYFNEFRGNYSKQQSVWGAFGDYFNLIVNIINAIVVGILSYLVYNSQKARNEFEKNYIEADERPVLIFAVNHDQNKWYVYNVGKGAALNVVIANDNPTNGEWINPKKCYSLAPNEKMVITWFQAAHKILGIYTDIFNNNYTSICAGDETIPHKYGEALVWMERVKKKATRLGR